MDVFWDSKIGKRMVGMEHWNITPANPFTILETRHPPIMMFRNAVRRTLNLKNCNKNVGREVDGLIWHLYRRNHRFKEDEEQV